MRVLGKLAEWWIVLRGHPGDGQILAYIEDEAPARAAVRIEAHLATCQRCAGRAAEMRQSLQALSGLRLVPESGEGWIEREAARLNMALAAEVRGQPAHSDAIADDLLRALLGRAYESCSRTRARETAALLLGSRAVEAVARTGMAGGGGRK